MRVHIVGGGIGGLVLAIALADRGITDVRVFEAKTAIREVGVALNLHPAGVQALQDLGLENAITPIAAPITSTEYRSSRGQLVWNHTEGPTPRYGMHRGRMLVALLRNVEQRLGPDRIHTDHRLTDLTQHPESVEATFATTSPPGLTTWSSDVVVAADGFNSATRRLLFPDALDPQWTGVVIWRGITVAPDFIDHQTMVVAGHSSRLFRVFPISPNPNSNPAMGWVARHRLLQWQPMPSSGWGDEIAFEDVLAAFSPFRFDSLDVPELIRRAEVIYRHPLMDREPLERWSQGPVTLLGDAAHGALLAGGTGASQAVIDAKSLARELSTRPTIEAAFQSYEQQRRPAVDRLIDLSREGGPTRILDMVEERAPDGFDRIEDVVDPRELEQQIESFQRAAFDTK